jgi:hypothetical protein
MAGTLTISTLSDGTNSTSATNPIKGSAKAWVNYNGATQTINSSFNVSSVTYNATGNYTINFTTAMSNIYYSVVNGYHNETSGYDSFSTSTYVANGFASTTTACKVASRFSSAGVFVNLDQIGVAVFNS